MDKPQKRILDELVIPIKKCVATEGIFRWPEKPVLASSRMADTLTGVTIAAINTDFQALAEIKAGLIKLN